MFLSPPSEASSGAAARAYADAYQSIISRHRSSSSVSAILLAVAPDIDALCTARMLGALFTQDNITHRVTPVAGLAGLVALRNELEGTPVKSY